MKKIILLIALAITTTISYGQSTFDKLEDMDGVMSVVISKDAFKILSKFNFESENEGNEMTSFSIKIIVIFFTGLKKS